MVDIMPSIASHLNLVIPEPTRKEIDGVSFVGLVDISQLKATNENGGVLLQWKILNSELDSLEIFTSGTNYFSTGGEDVYEKVKTVSAKEERFWFNTEDSVFSKILIKTPNQYLNVWAVKK